MGVGDAKHVDWSEFIIDQCWLLVVGCWFGVFECTIETSLADQGFSKNNERVDLDTVGTFADINALHCEAWGTGLAKSEGEVERDDDDCHMPKPWNTASLQPPGGVKLGIGEAWGFSWGVGPIETWGEEW